MRCYEHILKKQRFSKWSWKVEMKDGEVGRQYEGMEKFNV